MTAPTRRKPTKTEIAARDAAVAEAGGSAPPQTAGAGFASLVGHEGPTQALRRAVERNRLPHAILLHGPSGVGKATCAGILAQALNCASSDFKDACGSCVSCRKVARGLHPDVLWVEPLTGKIRLAQVAIRKSSRTTGPEPPREPIVSWVGYRPYEGTRRVVVIDDADAMNTPAQNALLKTLEEPPGSLLLLLVTARPGSLLPTIRSRCQPLRFQPLPLGLLRAHLEDAEGLPSDEARLRAALAPGSIGKAVSLDIEEYMALRDVAESAIEDAVQGGAALLAAAETFLAAGVGERKIEQALSAIGAVRDILRDLLVLNAGNDEHLMVNLDRASDWAPWADTLDPESIVTALDAVQRAEDKLHGAPQPNARLTVEEALIGAGAALRRGVVA